ncbi:MAG: sporulation protein YqfD [Bacilli bacterium]
MQDSILNRFRNVLKIKIEGRNLERFIHRMIKNKIEIIEIKYKNYKEAYVKIFAKDYEKLEEIKTIYNISIVDSYGLINIKKRIKYNTFLISSIIIGFIALILLTNMIFSVDIIHNNKDIRKLLLTELSSYNIKPGTFRKSYKSLDKIKKKILSDYKDKIEWLEIERVGTKYIVRLELRELKVEPEVNDKRNVVAKKSAIIKKVEAKSGEIVKNVNEYVQKGDVVITGEIKLNEEVKSTISAEGKVYGEVWYKVKTEFPLFYSEKQVTNETNKVYAVKILNKTIELFNFKHYKDKKIDEKILFSSFYFPFQITKQKQTKIIKTENIYTEEEAIKEASKLALEKMNSQLNDNEYVIDQKNLKVSLKDSKIILDTFFTVYEDITDYAKIEEQPKEE